MRKIHNFLTVFLICLSLILIKEDTFADTFAAWEKDENGIYLNSNGASIKGAAKRGIDISKWQYRDLGGGVRDLESVDWDKVAADDVSFVMIRTGVGVEEDPTFTTSIDACDRLGLPYGVYHYTHARTEAEAIAEAQLVLRMIEGRTLSYPIYYDIEGDPNGEKWLISNEQWLKNAKAFCAAIEKTGYEAGIYANKNWFQNKLTDTWYASKDRWISRYISDYTYKWPEMADFTGIWQCSNTGSVDGINGNVDIDFIIEGAPAKVSSFKGKSAAYNKHTLTWKTISGVDGYVIQGKKTSAKSYKTIANVNGDISTYTVKSRTTGTNYDYRIRAYKKLNGETVYGKYIYAKKVKASLSKPSISSVTRKKTKVTIKWKKVSGASGYKIYYSKTKNGKYKLLKKVSGGSKTSYKYTLKKGRYYYKIRAYRKVSKKTTVNSSYSAKKRGK